MKPNNQPQDRQQILIDLYLQYLKQEITTGELLKYLRNLSQSIMDKVLKPLGLQTGLVPTHLHVIERILKMANE